MGKFSLSPRLTLHSPAFFTLRGNKGGLRTLGLRLAIRLVIWMCVLLTSRSACINVVHEECGTYVCGTKMCNAVARYSHVPTQYHSILSARLCTFTRVMATNTPYNYPTQPCILGNSHGLTVIFTALIFPLSCNFLL